MTSTNTNTKKLNRLTDIRRMLRDKSSAEVARAKDQLLNGQRVHEAAQSDEGAFCAETPRILSEATSARALWSVDEQRRLHRTRVQQTAEALQPLRASHERASTQLRERTRALRTSERLLDRAHETLARTELRAEQRTLDELTARRWRFGR